MLNTASTSESVFVVLDNGNTNALATSGTGGNIITKHENNQVKWNIGTNTGTYTYHLQPLQQPPMHPNLKFRPV